MTKAARLVVVSGPSGVGKTSVCAALAAREEFERVITATTRTPRGNESHGVDYLFMDREEFERVRDGGGFLEWALVHADLYAAPRDQAEAILSRGRHALLNVDVQGAASIRATNLPRLLVFLLPPSFDVLEERLKGRGTDDEETIARRLGTARLEMARRGEFDIEVVNDDVERAADEIAAQLC